MAHKNTHTWIRIVGRLAAERPTATPEQLATALVPMLDEDGALPSLADTPSVRLDALGDKARHLVGLWIKGHQPAKRTPKPTTTTTTKPSTTGRPTLPSTQDATAPTTTKGWGRVRDYQRMTVYRWGWARPEWDAKQLTMREVGQLVKQICSDYDIPMLPIGSKGSGACFYSEPVGRGYRGLRGEVVMDDKDGDRWSVSLKFAPTMRQPLVVLHEVAHYFTAQVYGHSRMSSHGSEFMAIFCHLFARYIGGDEDAIRDSARHAGCRVAPRS